MVVIGIDPGYSRTGFAVVRKNGNRFSVLDFGVILPEKSLTVSERAMLIFKKIDELCKLYKPSSASIEELFFVKNVKSGIKVGQMRGVDILAFALNSVPVYEYTPKEIKMAVTGSGAATKEQVVKVVSILTGVKEGLHHFDAYDAVAAAICHINSVRMSKYDSIR